MNRRALPAHILIVTAVVAGIIGMGTVFDAVMHGSMTEFTRGVPLLLMGLWWAGRELSRSMLASHARRAAGQNRGNSTARTR